MQQGDVSLFQTIEDGNIEVVNGVITMSGGLGTAAYLSLFGGNIDDPATAESSFNWWGNLDENDESRRYRSETQYLLRSLPATSFNLRRIEDAARRDLDWMLEEKVASSIDVEATVPQLNRVKLTVNIEARGEQSNFEFVENWQSTL